MLIVWDIDRRSTRHELVTMLEHISVFTVLSAKAMAS